MRFASNPSQTRRLALSKRDTCSAFIVDGPRRRDYILTSDGRWERVRGAGKFCAYCWCGLALRCSGVYAGPAPTASYFHMGIVIVGQFAMADG
ncbi:unnamed protein product, partial [Iphiclides podalirius]